MLTGMPLVAYIIGPTNSGKSTLLNLCAGNTSIHTVEVGKMMRAKYPPSYFQGQNNPKHTADEAWQMYLDGVQRGMNNPACHLVMCDGQPRDTKQVEDIIAQERFRKVFVHLWAPNEVLAARAEARDSASPEALALSKARLVNDIPANYNVLVRLLNARQTVWSFDTSHAEYSAQGVLDRLIHLSRYEF